MKVTSILFTAILAVASVQAVPIQEPSPEDVQVNKVKRAAEAIADALAAPLPVRHKEIWCYMPGQPCYKAKRDALALSEAFAEASASTDSELVERSPEPTKKGKEIWCYLPGQPCYKARRDALANAKRSPEPTKKGKEIWCYMPGQPCYKAKRDALAIAQEHEDAKDLVKRSPEPTKKGKEIWCYMPGQPCYKTRRAALALVDAVAEN